MRTVENLRSRLPAMVPQMRIAVIDGRIVGFCVLKGDELDQLYVARDVRGAGVAQRLIDDAEQRLRAAGVGVAWLACAIGNDRAARFYEKRGWTRTRTVTIPLGTDGATVPLDVWRYEKKVSG